MRSQPSGSRHQTNIQLNNFQFSGNSNREHILQVGASLNKNYNNLRRRLQNAKDSKDFSHIPGSECMIKEMRSEREELCKLGGLQYETSADWHDIITTLQDKLEAQKLEHKRAEDSYKQNSLNKRKTISSVRQNDLPILKDSIDFQLWDESVTEIMNALKDADSALAKHAIVSAIRKSLQGPQVLNLSRMATSTSDLRTILRSIKTVMNIPFTVMKDLKARLAAMPRVVSMQIMHDSANTICQLIETISKRKMMESVTPEILQMLIDKSCTFSHALAYNKDVNHALANSVHKNNPIFAGMSEMEQVSYRLRNHDSFIDIEPPSPDSTVQQIPVRIAFLYTHLREFLQSHMTDLNYTPDTQYRNRATPSNPDNGASSTVKYHTFNVNCEDEEDMYNGDGEGEDQEENVYLTAAK